MTKELKTSIYHVGPHRLVQEHPTKTLHTHDKTSIVQARVQGALCILYIYIYYSCPIASKRCVLNGQSPPVELYKCIFWSRKPPGQKSDQQFCQTSG